MPILPRPTLTPELSVKLRTKGVSSGNSVNKCRDRPERRLRLISLRRMSAILQRQHFHWSGSQALNRLHLPHRPILILETLDDQDRTGNPRQIVFDVPASKIRMQPDVVPSPECPPCIAVMPRQSLGQIGGFKLRFRSSDARHAQVLHKDM